MAVFEIKINNKWGKVRAKSIKTIDEYCKKNNIKDWRMIGMMSRNEIKKSKYLKIIE